MTVTCGIQSTGVVTMAMEMLRIACNMCIHDLPDMNALLLRAAGIHIRQIPHAHVITIMFTQICSYGNKLEIKVWKQVKDGAQSGT